MKIVKISSKGQVTLPQIMLQSLNINPNMQVLLEQRQNEIVIKPLKSSVAKELAGCLRPYIHPSKLGIPFEKVREETKRIVAKKLALKK